MDGFEVNLNIPKKILYTLKLKLLESLKEEAFQEKEDKKVSKIINELNQ